jgi:hypothetical protein
VDIGTPIALLAGEDEDVSAVAKTAPKGGSTASAAPVEREVERDEEDDEDEAHEAEGARARGAAPADGGRKRISPVARRAASRTITESTSHRSPARVRAGASSSATF